MRIRQLLVFAILAACTASPRPAATGAGGATVEGPSLEWQIAVGADFSVDETICWRGFVPEHIAPDSPEALRFARGTIDGGGISAGQTTGCEHLVFALGDAARVLDEDRLAKRIGDAVFGSFDAWLWRPTSWPKGLHGKLRIAAPAGIEIALPFRAAPDGAYVVPFDTWTFMSRTAVGRMRTDRVQASGASITIHTLPGAAPRVSSDGLRRFASGAARAVATLDGRMPVDELQLFVLPGTRASAGDDPVHFGMAMRGGGPHVMLFVAENATDDAIYGEWIGVHELSHLWLPQIDGESAWLSEGFASYYQCILRSRVGMYGEAAAWSELRAGFARGREQAGTTRLRDARRPRFQQIYWGGAAIMLAIDVALRRRHSSLDRVVARLRRTASDETELTADAVLDALEGREIAERMLAVPFPDMSRELAELGVGDTLDDRAPLAAMRREIATRP